LRSDIIAVRVAGAGALTAWVASEPLGGTRVWRNALQSALL